MRLIIHRHILKSIWGPLWICLLIFTFTFFVYRIFQLTDLIINKGVGAGAVFRLFLYASPSFFMFTIPMSVMFAVLITFLRLRSDNELTALKAAGVSLYRLLPPVLVLVIGAWGVTLVLSTVFLPRGNTALRDTLFHLASTQTEAALRERIFIKDFEGLTLFVRSIDQASGELSQVFIYDDRGSTNDAAIMARRGLFLKDPKADKVVLRLFNGVIDQLARDWSDSQSITFTTYDLTIRLKALAKERRKSSHRSEWSMAKLRRKMKTETGWRLRRVSQDFHERLAIPTACLVLGLLAVPLAVGLGRPTTTRSLGAVRGVLVFLLYYLLYSFMRSLADRGFLPHWAGLWLPNLICLLAALIMTHRAANEKGSRFFDRLTLVSRLERAREFFSKKA